MSSEGSRQARAETAICARLSHRAHTRTLNPPHASGLLLCDVRTTPFLCLRCLSHAAEVQQQESWCVRCSSALRALFGVVAANMCKACRARWSRRRHPARREHDGGLRGRAVRGALQQRGGRPPYISPLQAYTKYYKGASGLGSVASAAVCASRGSMRDALGAGFWVIAHSGFVLILGALHPPRPRWVRETLSRMGMSANPIKPFVSCNHSTYPSYEVLEKAEAEGKGKGSATEA